MFAALEKRVGVPSAMALVWWVQVRLHFQCLLRTSTLYKKMADRHHTKGPHYQVCQQVWLSTRNLLLHMENWKLSPHFVGLFPESKVINPVAVRLKLPRTMTIHSTFHFKPVHERPLAPHIPQMCQFQVSSLCLCVPSRPCDYCPTQMFYTYI